MGFICYYILRQETHLMARSPADARRLASHVKNNRRTMNNNDVAVGKFQLAMPVILQNRVPIALLHICTCIVTASLMEWNNRLALWNKIVAGQNTFGVFSYFRCLHLCHSHHFLCWMPFLAQSSQFMLAWDRHQTCWLAYPVAWLLCRL